MDIILNVESNTFPEGSNNPEVLGDLITMKEKHLKKG